MGEWFDSETGNPERFNSAQHERREDEVRNSIEEQYSKLEYKGEFYLFADKHYIGLFTDLQEAIHTAFQYDEGDTKFKIENP